MISQKIKDELEVYNSLLGCVKFNNTYNFYLMPIAWWILDYKSYDPVGSAKNNPAFRNNIYSLDNMKIEPFIDSIKEYRITNNDVVSIIDNYKDDEYDKYSELLFLIDFDAHTYITSFYDIDVLDYLPKNWVGSLDNPLNFIPEELKALWKKKWLDSDQI